MKGVRREDRDTDLRLMSLGLRKCPRAVAGTLLGVSSLAMPVRGSEVGRACTRDAGRGQTALSYRFEWSVRSSEILQLPSDRSGVDDRRFSVSYES